MSGIKHYIEELIEKTKEYDNLGLINNIFITNDSKNNSCYCKGPAKGETLCPCQLKNSSKDDQSIV